MRILLLGLAPLPTENESHTLGPGKRTWQFAQSLLAEGHRVCLVCSRHVAAYQNRKMKPVSAEEHGNLIYYSMDQNIFEDLSWIQRLHDRFQPACVIGATVFPSFIAVRLRTDKPVWADLFGHIMAEAQTKAHVFSDDYYLTQMWKMEREILDRADIFSVVSKPQSYATIGELGTRGRLNRLTTGYRFVHVVPCAINSSYPVSPPSSDRIMRGTLVAEDDFVILWSGGYNTWTDISTLYNALEKAFSINQKIKFVSTGGEISGHDDLTYKRFLEMTKQSRYREHYIFCGWRTFNEIPLYWQEADIGINIDLFSYEAILGSRNRILDWMCTGLPVVTSELCELSDIIKQKYLGYTFRPENAEELTQLILSLAADRGKLRESAARAREYALREFSVEKTTQALRQWVKNPEGAPDSSIAVTGDWSSRLDSSAGQWKHYTATIRNQMQKNGLIGTAGWILSRYKSMRRG